MPAIDVNVHAFPECEKMWLHLDAESQEQARRSASRIWAASRSDIGESDPDVLLGQQEGEESLVIDGGTWELESHQILLYVQSINIIDSKGLHSRPAEEVVRELAELLNERFEHMPHGIDSRNLVSFAIAQLINMFSRSDVLDLLVSKDAEGVDFWSFYEPICDALPVLNQDKEDSASLLIAITARVGQDLHAGRVFLAAHRLGTLRPQRAFELIDLFADMEDSDSSRLLASLVTGIAKSSPENRQAVTALCQEWIGSARESLCEAGLQCLHDLVFTGGVESGWLLARVEALVPTSTDRVRAVIAQVIASLGVSFDQHSQDCLKQLRGLKERGPKDQVAHGIASALAYVRDNAALDYQVSCLSLLTDIPLANKGTIRLIRDLLHSITRSEPAEAWKYVEKWILAHEQDRSVAEHDVFLDTIQDAFRRDADLGRKFLTRWFVSPDLHLVEQTRTVLHELEIQSFCAEEVRAMLPETVIYMAEKLLVGGFESNQILHLFHSILRNAFALDELQNYFSRVLRYLTWNYPASAREFFDQVITEADSSLESGVLRKARQNLEVYHEQREGIAISELAPSRQRARKYQEFESKQTRKIQEALSEDSRFPLLKFIPKVAVSRGDRTFHMNVFHPDTTQKRTFSEPSGFGEYAETIELPRGEILDPEGEARGRLVRLSYTPDDIRPTRKDTER